MWKLSGKAIERTQRQVYSRAMSPIPGEPHETKPDEITTSDGRKVKLKIPGMAPRPVPQGTQERGAAEPPRDDPRLPTNPNHLGP
jgi:hypothetical protein